MLRVDLACGMVGDPPVYKSSFRQLTGEMPEDLIERITTVLFENIEQLTYEDGADDENE